MMRAVLAIILAVLCGESSQAQQVAHPLNAPLAPYTTGDIVTFCGIQQTCDTPILLPAQGGTGVNNGTKTLTLGGNLSTANLLAITDMNVTNDVSYVPSPGNLGHESLSALMDAVFGSAQGDILYRDASSWMVLTPGIAGQPLQTGGPSANPTFSSIRQVMTAGTNATQATNTTKWYTINGSSSTAFGGDVNAKQLFPLGGTFKNLFCSVTTAPGTGNTDICTLLVDGSAPVSGPTCTISNSATSCSDAVDTATIVAGHFADIENVTSASATATGQFYSGIEFDNP